MNRDRPFGQAVSIRRHLVAAKAAFCSHVISVLRADACAACLDGLGEPGRRALVCCGMNRAQARRLCDTDGAASGVPSDGGFHGLERLMWGEVPVGGRGRLRVTVLRSPGQPPFTPDDRERLDGLCTLAVALLDLAIGASELALLWRTSGQVLDRLAVGVVMIDADGAVLASNRTARDLAAGTLALTAAAGTRPMPPASAAPFQRALQQSRRQSGNGCAGPLPGGDGTIAVVSTPLDGAGRAVSAGTAVFLSDIGRVFAPYQDWLCRVYGLSRLEAQLVTHIVEGCSLAEIATTLRVSIHTVRSYLKQIFAKTGVHRQAGLVKLVVAGIGQVRVDDGPAPRPSRAGAPTV